MICCTCMIVFSPPEETRVPYDCFFSAWGNTGASGWWQCMVRSHLCDNPKQQPNPTPFAKDSMGLLVSAVKVASTLSMPCTQPCNSVLDLESCGFTSFASGFVLLLKEMPNALVCPSTFCLPVLVKRGITVTSLSKSSVCCLSSLSGSPVQSMRRDK